MGTKELAEHVADLIKPVSPETAEAQQLVEQYQEEVTKAKGQFYNDSKPSKFLVGQIILKSDPRLQVEILRAIVTTRFPRYGSPLLLLRAQLLNRRLPLSPKLIDALLAQAIESNVLWGQLGCGS